MGRFRTLGFRAPAALCRSHVEPHSWCEFLSSPSLVLFHRIPLWDIMYVHEAKPAGAVFLSTLFPCDTDNEPNIQSSKEL